MLSRQNVLRKICSSAICIDGLKTLVYIILFYSFSISLTFYNKWIIKRFNVPLSMTMAHLVVKFLLAMLIRQILTCTTRRERTMLSWSPYCKRMAATGIAAALDIGLSNWSFQFITISLYTMSKSTAIVFILGFAILLKLEKLRWHLILVILLIATGLFMFVYHSTQFNLMGFLLVLGATVLSGVRWTLSQVITQKNELGLHNPIDMIYHVQPWMIVGLLPLSLYFEGLTLGSTTNFFRSSDLNQLTYNCALVFLGAFLAFLLETSEYLLVSHTSSLTLSIAGIFKELCTIYLAVKINHNELTPLNTVGFVVCLLGITVHVVLRAISNRDENSPSSAPMRTREETSIPLMMKAFDDTDEDGEEDHFV